MRETLQPLLPGTHVKVKTKHSVDGENLCGVVLGAAPNTLDAYVVEYHPGLDNGQHDRYELSILDEQVCRKTG